MSDGKLIERFRLLKSNEKMHALHDFEEDILAANDLDSILMKVVEAGVQLTEAEEGTLFLLDANKTEFHVRAQKNEGGNTKIMRQKADITLIKNVIETGKPLNYSGDEKYTTDFKAKSLLCVPMKSRKEFLGVLCVHCFTKPLKFNAEDEYLLLRLTTHAATAFALEKAERRANTLSGITSISQSLLSLDELDKVLELIVDKAKELLEADVVLIYTYDKETKEVKVPPVYAGELNKPEIIMSRGVGLSYENHKNSLLFKIILGKKAIFAENGLKDLVELGLYETRQLNDYKQTFLDRESIASSISIPLIYANDVVGALFINYRNPKEFTLELRQAVRAISRNATIAIHGAKIAEIGRLISSATTLDIDKLLETILRQTSRVMNVTNFYIALYDEDTKSYTFPLHIDEFDIASSFEPQELNHSLTEYVRKTKKPKLVTPEEHKKLIENESVMLVGTDSPIWLGAPMISRERVIGIIVVQDYREKDAFSNEHLNILSKIADFAGVAIENALIIGEIQRKVKELSMDISQFQELIKTDANVLFKFIIKQAVHITDAQAGSFLLCDSSNNITKVVATYGSSKLMDLSYKYGEGVAGRVAVSGAPLIVNDYPNWIGRAEMFNSETYKGMLKAVVGIPLNGPNGVLGVLVLSDNRKERYFTDDHVILLSRFAKPAIEAILLQKDYSQYRVMVENSPEAIISINSTGIITQYNSTAESILEYKKNEIIGKSAIILFWDGQLTAGKIHDLLKNEAIRNYELFAKSKSGVKIPILLSAASLKDDKGNIVGSLGTFTDMRISSLRGRIRGLINAIEAINAQDDLENLAQTILLEFTTLFEGDEGIIFLLGQELILSTSEQLSDTKEYLSIVERERISSETELVVFPESKSNNLRYQLPESYKSAFLIPLRVEDNNIGIIFLYSKKDNHFSFEREYITVLITQATFAINRAQLIAERNLTQSQLLVSQRIVIAGQLAAGVSHEVYNCLNNIKLTVADIGSQILSNKQVDQKSNIVSTIEDINNEIERLAQLTRDIHKISLRLEPDREIAYLNDIVEKTLQTLHGTLRINRMKGDVKYDPRLSEPEKKWGYPIFVDKRQIQQVVINLVLNAIDASSKNSSIFISTILHPTKNEVEFSVRDTGIGISNDNRPQLFKPFFTTKKDGTGLGLYICRLIVHNNHGGRLDFQSYPGKGTTFSFFLPVKQE